MRWNSRRVPFSLDRSIGMASEGGELTTTESIDSGASMMGWRAVVLLWWGETPSSAKCGFKGRGDVGRLL